MMMHSVVSIMYDYVYVAPRQVLIVRLVPSSVSQDSAKAEESITTHLEGQCI